MADIGAYEAKTHFAALLDRVEKGERINIKRHGRIVAVLSPAPGARDRTIDEAIAGIRKLRRGQTLGDDFSVRQLIDSGRE